MMKMLHPSSGRINFSLVPTETVTGSTETSAASAEKRQEIEQKTLDAIKATTDSPPSKGPLK